MARQDRSAFREWTKGMSGAVFDTLAAAGTLGEAEFGERQAEAITSVVRHAIDTDRGEFATKADLKAEIAALEARLANRLLAAVLAIVAAHAALRAAAVAILEFLQAPSSCCP